MSASFRHAHASRLTAHAVLLLVLACLATLAGATASEAVESRRCDGEKVTIYASPGGAVGTPGDDVILGTTSGEIIVGDGGNDRICGAGGDDFISGGPGKDRIFAGSNGTSGILHIYGDERADFIKIASATIPAILDGGDGSDTIIGGPFNDEIEGGIDESADRITGGSGNDQIHGGPGADVLIGGDAAGTATHDEDNIFGEDGNDQIEDRDGDDRIDAGPGNDRVTVHSLGGDDPVDEVLVFGRDGDDTVRVVSNGEQNLIGGSGHDYLAGGDFIDVIDGNDGNDTIFGLDGDDIIDAGPGEDGDPKAPSPHASKVIDGGEGDDKIKGGTGNDWIHGGPGIDTIDGQEDNDRLWGDAGPDNVDGGAGDDQIHGGPDIDGLFGGDDADRIFGDAGNDSIQGDGGNDILKGGDDNDICAGGTGEDSCDGGSPGPPEPTPDDPDTCRRDVEKVRSCIDEIYGYDLSVEFTAEYEQGRPTETYTFTGKIDRAAPGAACEPECQGMTGPGSWTGQANSDLSFCDATTDDDILQPTSGTTDVIANFQDYDDPNTDVNGDGRVGDELYWGANLFGGNNEFLFDSPGGFFPAEGGTFKHVSQDTACSIGGEGLPFIRTWIYTITPIAESG